MSRKFYLGKGKYAKWPKGAPDAMGLTYADVNLVPKMSGVTSRSEVDTTLSLMED